MVLPRLLLPALCGAVLASWGALPAVEAAFYVCPKGCMAMLLPRDMGMIDDCLCDDDVDTTAAEKEADENDTGVFACLGRYKTKRSVTSPQSVEDCDCFHPYEKHADSSECILTSCPRAGNYEPRLDTEEVTSLADCTCTAPFVKLEESGQCLLNGEGGISEVAAKSSKYKCPPNSTPTPDSQPRSFADCHCSWGFVRNSMEECERERAAYVCPINSAKRSDLPIGERPRGFFDCECLADGNYHRDEDAHACRSANHKATNGKPKRKNNKRGVDGEEGQEEFMDEVMAIQPYECPPFSRAVATVPHSVEQCQCLPGYAWKLPEMTCARASSYRCPPHAYKRSRVRGSEVEVSFEDCSCARGYFRDAVARRCVPWMLSDDNSCPAYAVLNRWPLQSNANCQCIYGLNKTTHETEVEALRKAEEEEVADGGTLDETPPARQYKKECNVGPPADSTSKTLGDFSQCPRDSFATNWPVATADDCVCLSSFEMAPLSAEEVVHGVGDGFRCVASSEKTIEEAAAACRAPQVVHPLSGECRLPVEEVTTKKKTKKLKSKADSVLFKGIEYDYELVDGNVMVIQGDVAIGERLVWHESDPEDSEDEGEARVEHALHGYYNSERDHRWPRAELCFQVDKSARPFLRTLLAATEHVTHATGFKFHRCQGDNCRTDMACLGHHDFLVVRGVQSSCFSFVGRIGGPQRLGISADCGLGNLVHVLLHTLGVRHAMDREDRDEHVRISWECIPEAKRSFFVAEDLGSAPISTKAKHRVLEPPPYDLFSVMHHPVDAFVHSDPSDEKPQWCPSVVPLIADLEERVAVMRKMGQRERMTTTDVESVWAIYPGLKKKHHEHQKADQSGEAQVEDLHDSFLHTQDDTLQSDAVAGRLGVSGGRSFGQRFMSFLGGVAMLVGFGAMLAFATAEVRRRALLGSDSFYYSEALLVDANDI
ncbi:hypothetical protein BBJ28_00002321 [Nothophytophthora sp. Chile5]|nr:hypothetical protein BBJ28_00002321 [Nothophytophthora sp. Chile5]